MKITVARAAGFCMGVRRAMQICLEQARRTDRPLWTHGPLIHNPQVIRLLEDKKVRVLSDGVEHADGGTVVVRAHGITPEEEERLCACGYAVVDATCPHVIRIQKLIERHVAKGESAIIIGDHGHAEVNGLLGHARGAGYVVASEEDIASLPTDLERVCVVSQTTQSHERFDRLVERLKERWPDCSVHRTICNSTQRRQEETVAIAREVDAMVVVGGRNSANTVRLAELAAETGTQVQHVETADELDYEALRDAKTIGLTAGASTPNWLIADAAERINAFFRKSWPFPLSWAYVALRLLVDTNIFIGVGAGCTLLASAAMLRIPVTWVTFAVASLYVFAMHCFNIIYERPTERFRDPLRWQFHVRWGRWLVGAGLTALSASILLAGLLGLPSVLLVGAASAGGVFYRLRLVPRSWNMPRGYRRLSDIPGSKDVLSALAWAVVPGLLPVVAWQHGEHSPHVAGLEWLGVFASCIFVFVMVFSRSVVLDLRDIQGDEMIGRETIPVALGNRRTRYLLGGLVALAACLLAAATAAGVVAPVGYLLEICLIYVAGYLYLYRLGTINLRGLLFELVVGSGFLLAGLIAATAKTIW